jgi:hypothetical protein
MTYAHTGVNYAVGIGSLRTSCMLQSADGPVSYRDQDVVALLVLIDYLTRMEGPFWVSIRGLGLSYSYDLNLNVDLGLLTFLLDESENVVNAWAESRKIVREFMDGTRLFDPLFLEVGCLPRSRPIASSRFPLFCAWSVFVSHMFSRQPTASGQHFCLV